MKARIIGMVFLMTVIIAFTAGCKSTSTSARAWAWVYADGAVYKHGGVATIEVTRVGTGQYCIQTNPNILEYLSPIIATVQGVDLYAAFINANTCWSGVCDNYGGHGVFTADISGKPQDMSFTVVIP